MSSHLLGTSTLGSHGNRALVFQDSVPQWLEVEDRSIGRGQRTNVKIAVIGVGGWGTKDQKRITCVETRASINK